MQKNPGRTYLLARLPLAVSMAGHGLERILKFTEFRSHLAAQFNKFILPPAIVSTFSYTLPYLESITGALLILGLFTRFACALGVMLMLALIFGSSLIEQWDDVFMQLIYGAYFSILYYFAFYNKYSLDRWLLNI